LTGPGEKEEGAEAILILVASGQKGEKNSEKEPPALLSPPKIHYVL
jgi:hypothetical protein